MASGRSLARGVAERLGWSILVAAVLAVVLVAWIWLSALADIDTDRNQTLAAALKRNDVLVLAHEEQAIRLIREVDQMLLLVRERQQGRVGGLPLATLFEGGIVDPNTITFLAVYDAAGRAVESAPDMPLANIAERPVFARARDSPSSELAIGRPLQRAPPFRDAIPLARRIDGPGGTFAGVVVAGVDPAHFTALFNKSDLGPADVMALVRTDGIVLARRHGSMSTQGEDVSGTPMMSLMRTEPSGHYIAEGTLDPARKLFSYRRVEGYPLLVVTGTTERNALAAFEQREQRNRREAMISALIVIIATLAIIVALNRRRHALARIAEQVALIDEARDAIVVRDLEGRITFWNKGAERIYGWTADEAVGQRLDALLWIDPAGFDEATRAVLERGEWYAEVTHRHKDGRSVIIEDRWSLLSEEGPPRAILAIKTDITQRSQMEARLRQSQQLEAVGQLTGGVAHDFNNLLTVILGSADMLALRSAGDPGVTRLTRMIVTAATSGAELTRRLLAFARRQSLDPRTIEPNKLIEGMLDLLKRSLSESIEIRLELAAGLWTVSIDPGQLENALLNLCVNARDAMPSGGRITIESSNLRLDQAHAAEDPDFDAGDYVLISVSDTGAGIPPHVLPRVFDPFFTTKEAGKGTGLGLSMVYGFVRQSRGHVRIYSELGHGTVVRIYLPRGSSEAVAPTVPAAMPSDVHGTERILLVEDDALVRAYAQEQLRELGYDVIVATNGTEALEVLGKRDDIDLLFTDVVMPGGLNGPDLAEKARAMKPGLRIVFSSGYTEAASIAQGRLRPGDSLLNKPYRRTGLAIFIRSALDGAPQPPQPPQDRPA